MIWLLIIYCGFFISYHQVQEMTQTPSNSIGSGPKKDLPVASFFTAGISANILTRLLLLWINSLKSVYLPRNATTRLSPWHEASLIKR